MTRGYDFSNPATPTLRALTYNADNKPISITLGGATTTLTYDGEGGRVKKEGPSGLTLYIGRHYEIGPSGPVKYVFAGNQRVAKIADSGTYYFHGDHLNSASVITSAAGSVVETTNYQPFGSMRAPAASFISNFKFTDQELDPETGLYYYGARYYDPAIGRFISADTIVPDPADPQSLNRYSYVQNNPLIYVDPTGHLATDMSGWYPWDFWAAGGNDFWNMSSSYTPQITSDDSVARYTIYSKDFGTQAYAQVSEWSKRYPNDSAYALEVSDIDSVNSAHATIENAKLPWKEQVYMLHSGGGHDGRSFMLLGQSDQAVSANGAIKTPLSKKDALPIEKMPFDMANHTADAKIRLNVCKSAADNGDSPNLAQAFSNRFKDVQVSGYTYSIKYFNNFSHLVVPTLVPSTGFGGQLEKPTYLNGERR